jgi:ribulose 1,5-bisphosphate carboxylase large subunit-like protein
MLGVLPVSSLEEDGISFESLVQAFTNDENSVDAATEALSLLNRRIVGFDPKVLDAFIFPKFEATIIKKIYVRIAYEWRIFEKFLRTVRFRLQP